MRFFQIVRGASLLALISGIVTTGAQGHDTTTSTTKTSPKAPWDDPTHTPTTFTTISLTYSSNGRDVAATASLSTRESSIPGFESSNFPSDSALITAVDSHETFVIFQTYGIITVTITVDGHATPVLYTGTFNAESMVTTDPGTRTVTQVVQMTVTDLAVKANGSVTTPASSSTMTNPLPPFRISSAGTMNSTAVYNNGTVNTQPGLPSATVTQTSGTTSTGATPSEQTTSTLTTTATGGSTTHGMSMLTKTHAEPSTTGTSTAAAAAPTVVKAIGALAAIGAAAVFML